MNCTDPNTYAAKLGLHDIDIPTYHEVITGYYAHEYEEVTKIEIRCNKVIERVIVR